MASRRVYDCDHCGEKGLSKINELQFTTGRQMDGAGSMEDVTESIDLCPICTGKFLSQVMNQLLDYQQRKAWVDKMRKK